MLSNDFPALLLINTGTRAYDQSQQVTLASELEKFFVKVGQANSSKTIIKGVIGDIGRKTIEYHFGIIFEEGNHSFFIDPSKTPAVLEMTDNHPLWLMRSSTKNLDKITRGCSFSNQNFITWVDKKWTVWDKQPIELLQALQEDI